MITIDVFSDENASIFLNLRDSNIPEVNNTPSNLKDRHLQKSQLPQKSSNSEKAKHPYRGLEGKLPKISLLQKKHGSEDYSSTTFEVSINLPVYPERFLLWWKISYRFPMKSFRAHLQLNWTKFWASNITASYQAYL